MNGVVKPEEEEEEYVDNIKLNMVEMSFLAYFPSLRKRSRFMSSACVCVSNSVVSHFIVDPVDLL